MLRAFGFAIGLLAVCSSYCSAGFLLRFDNQNTTANIGSTASVAVILEETAGTSFFNEGTFSASFSITNSNSSVASITSFTPNALLNSSPIINVGPTGGSFVISAPVFGTGVTGAQRTLGTLAFNVASEGTTNFQLGLHPGNNISELSFGSFPTFTPIDLNSGSVPVTFQTGSITAVPEPTSMALVAVAGAGLAGWRLRRSRKKAQRA